MNYYEDYINILGNNSWLNLDSYDNILSDDIIFELNCAIRRGTKVIRIKDYMHSIEKLSELNGLDILCIEKYENDIIKLPSNLKMLIIGDFSKNMINLPDSIEVILLGSKFDSFFEKWPKNLKKLKITYKINQLLDNLPDGLEILIIGGLFNYRLDNLPKTLKKLDFVGLSEFNQPLDNLPDGLVKLRVSGIFNQSLDFLPIGLKSLYITSKFNSLLDNLPEDLRELSFSSLAMFNNDINNLPDTIEILELPLCYYLKVRRFPKNLRKLRASMKFLIENRELLKKYPDIEYPNEIEI